MINGSADQPTMSSVESICVAVETNKFLFFFFFLVGGQMTTPSKYKKRMYSDLPTIWACYYCCVVGRYLLFARCIACIIMSMLKRRYWTRNELKTWIESRQKDVVLCVEFLCYAWNCFWFSVVVFFCVLKSKGRQKKKKSWKRSRLVRALRCALEIICQMSAEGM